MGTKDSQNVNRLQHIFNLIRKPLYQEKASVSCFLEVYYGKDSWDRNTEF